MPLKPDDKEIDERLSQRLAAMSPVHPAMEFGTMFRAFAMAVGITLCIMGGECLVVEKVVWAGSGENNVARAGQAPQGFTFTPTEKANNREYIPPEWLPWSLLSAGAITILYSITIPRRMNGD